MSPPGAASSAPPSPPAAEVADAACYSWAQYVTAGYGEADLATCPCDEAREQGRYLRACDPNYTGYRSDDASGAGLVPRGDPAASRDAGARGVQRDVASSIALGAVVIIFLFACVMQCARSYWREERRRRAREAHENNPWTRMEAARGHLDEGSGKPESSAGGSVVRGFMYGLYVINPTGSFSFGSVGVETNEREVRARREATAAAAAAAAAAEAAAREENEDEDEEGRGRRAAGGEDTGIAREEDHLDRRDSPRRIVRSPSGSLRGGSRLGALSGSGSNATLSRLDGRSGGSPAATTTSGGSPTSPDPSARSPSRDAPSSAATPSAAAPSPSLNPWAADDDALGEGARREARPPRVGGGGDPGTRGGALEALEAARRDAEGSPRTTAADDA